MKNRGTLLFNLAATQPNNGTKRHGGGIYGEIVLRKIIELGLPIMVGYDGSRWLNPEMRTLCEENTVEMVDISNGGFQPVIDHYGIRLFYSPQPLDDLYTLKNCRIVVTIHDLRPIELPLDKKMFWRYRQNLSMLLKNILTLMCPSYIKRRRYKKNANFISNPNVSFAVVSNHSLASVNLFFPESMKKDISVFFSPSTSLMEVSERKYQKDFYLLVSANRWEKNSLRAMIALDQLCSEGRLDGRRVIVTGVNSVDYFRYKFRNPDLFDCKGYVSDEELNQLYHDAYCFIYPSLNEGFGYPPLEAMRYGVPVLASPFSSISEVCGSAALYFNPFSIDEIKIRIIQLENKIVYDRMVEKSLQQYDCITERQKVDLENMVRFIYEQDPNMER